MPTVTVKVADLPEVKALLAEREATIQRLIAQADDLGQQVAQLQRSLGLARTDAAENYLRAEEAEQALVATKAELARVRDEYARWSCPECGWCRCGRGGAA